MNMKKPAVNGGPFFSSLLESWVLIAALNARASPPAPSVAA